MPVPRGGAGVDRRLVRVVVADRIRAAIVDGTLEPGETLRDDELTAWTGVSRTPVREAVATLERERLVRTTPGRSTVVAELDPVLAHQAAVTLLALVGASVARATASRTEIDPAATSAVVAASGSGRRALAAALVAWTRAVDQAGGNPVVLRLGDDLRPLVQRHLTLGAVPDELDPAASAARVLADAVRLGDRTGARRALDSLTRLVGTAFRS